MNIALAQLRTFAALRAVKHHPDQKVFSEIFKTMHLTGSSKERITRPELKSLAFDKKPSAARRDDINFVTRMRLLHVLALRSVNFYRQSPVCEEFGIKLAVARWDGALRVGKFDDAF